ncbi:polyadenylate-binding protein 6-like [Hibiscus syriacus]|uniref:polyadenylate-binding protein 6-like n=1 Tax=Hibiscus syriacus TaxID=106335 RepID=UPI00192321BC|nr:polyadenylate-binding protein 6-like [Hibiscus syriacus]
MVERERERVRQFVRPPMRNGLFFPDNLSRRVTRSELREIFNHYGIVVRVFIPKFMFKLNYTSSTFSFVQFTVEEGCRRAIQYVNGTLIDGKRVSVGVAKYNKDRRRETDGKNP